MAKLSILVLALLAGDAAAGVAAVSATQVKYPELKAKDPRNPTTKEYVEYMSLLMEKQLLTSFMGEPEASRETQIPRVVELTRC
jgi:hypothetical protein